MAVVSVAHKEGRMRIGSYSRKATTPSGCNEPFRKAYWCPRRKWFSKEPCPFPSKMECLNFSRFAGAV